MNGVKVPPIYTMLIQFSIELYNSYTYYNILPKAEIQLILRF